MSSTATTLHPSSTTSNVSSTIKMNSPYYQGQPQQGHQNPSPGQQQFPAGGPPAAPYPAFQQFPQQPLNPQQQQFAQWAYQQMMFQQQQLAFQPHGPMAQNQFLTPQQQALQLQVLQQQQQQQYLMQQQHAAAQQQQQQFPQPPHPPYARENNGSRTSLNSSNGSVKAGSNGQERRRTVSNKSAPSSSHPPGNRARTTSGAGSGQSSPALPSQPPTHRHRVSSATSHASGVSAAAPNKQPAVRSQSSHSSAPSSAKSSGASSPASPSPSPSASTNGTKARQPAKPSPLSQGSTPASGPKLSAKDVSQKPAPSAPADLAPTPAMLKSGGLKGRLRRALSFSALDEPSGDDAKNGSRKKAVNAKLAAEGQQAGSLPRSSSQLPRQSADSSANLARAEPPSPSSPGTPSSATQVPTEGSIRSTTTATAPKKSRSLFNAKFNRSTDNMSMSSTVSSASLMIRKLGSVGKLVRRNSLMGISNMFKKDKAESDGETKEPTADKKRSKIRKSPKGAKAEASVSHATVEVEPGSNSSALESVTSDELVGLSPAAKLARQHTLRSRAAEAARAKSDTVGPADPNQTPTTWEKNTATRAALSASARKSFGENGAPKGWSQGDENLSEDEGTFDGHQHQAQMPQQSQGLDWREHAAEGNSDSEEEEDYGYPYEDEDDTVRLDGQAEDQDPVDEPWAVGVRRSVERGRVPAKGILKNAQSYAQAKVLDGPPQVPFARIRNNSNDSAPPMGTEPGPLARIPSPDPDHIDGLHRSNSGSDRHSHHSRTLSTSSASSGAGGFLPALNFDESDSSALSSSLFAVGPSTTKERPLSGQSGSFAYANADFNASAPALATATTFEAGANKTAAPPLTLRSATVPLTKSKKLTFAANLSVYHTFSPAAYDRRSEPATCNRLTPVLAQRIKEELNSYKMEEMEVHPTSRAHTHFFV